MAKKKGFATVPATNAALQWHYGIVSEPPLDRVGMEYLAQHLPKRYKLEEDVLIVRKTGLPVAPRELAANQVKAKKTFHIVRAEFAKKEAASEQTIEDRPKEVAPIKDLHQSPCSSHIELVSTRHVEAKPASQAPTIVSDEGFAADWSEPIQPDRRVYEDSLAKIYSRFSLEDESTVLEHQLAFLSDSSSSATVVQRYANSSGEAVRTTPLFSGQVLDGAELGTFAQYSLLCKAAARKESQPIPNLTTPSLSHTIDPDPRIFLNVNAPWSTFICGSQGSGKSYTLSCILESCLIPSFLGKLPHPLAAIVFHYDTFTSYGSKQLCEAAYLCSSGVPVKILVSPTNFWRMKETYENLPILSSNYRKPEVIAMKFQDKHLNVARIMSMMAVSEKEGAIPLYIEVIIRILRDMAIESQGAPGFDYSAFRERVDREAFTSQQNAPLKLRLELLESFMDRSPKAKKGQQKPVFPDTGAARQARTQWLVQKARERSIEEHCADRAWKFEPGTLTIVDLSCPFVDESSACLLFGICLEIFLESPDTASRVVALDEAHKFMTSTAAATSFTDKLLQLIRQQRHLATRVVISTQEPTLSPRLLDLCTVTIVHRFTSPEWFRTLRERLAGINTLESLGETTKRNIQNMFAEIVELEPGEALMFSPSTILEMKEGEASRKLGMDSLKVRVRRRLTDDGGRSILAT
ncbi:hypothetical protein MMC25_002071 [Agyrium rufum]|nr:hypothetical protein [Agyrium rufum]